MIRLTVAALTGMLVLSPLVAMGQPDSRSRKPSVPKAEESREGLRVVPRPQPGLFSVNIYTDRNSYRIGDSVRVNFRTTRDAHVYIYSTGPSGQTTQIFPNYWDRDNSVQGGVTYSIPDRSYDLIAEGPGGRETISIVAVRGNYRAPDRYRTFSRSDPFPSAPRGEAAIRAVVPRERRGEFIAEDSTSIFVRGRTWNKPHVDDEEPRYLW